MFDWLTQEVSHSAVTYPVVGFSAAGEPVCGGGVKRLSDDTAEIKRMYVAEPARGQGVARRLLVALEDAARDLGQQRQVEEVVGRVEEDDLRLGRMPLQPACGVVPGEARSDDDDSRSHGSTLEGSAVMVQGPGARWTSAGR